MIDNSIQLEIHVKKLRLEIEEMKHQHAEKLDELRYLNRELLDLLKKDRRRVLDTQGAAELLGYKVSSVRTMTAQGILPHSKPVGGKVFYDRDELESWALEKGKVRGHAQIAHLAEQRAKAA